VVWMRQGEPLVDPDAPSGDEADPSTGAAGGGASA